VADEDHGHVLTGHHAQDFKQGTRLLGGQYSGGLIQDQQARTHIECLENLNPLLLTHGQLPHFRSQVQFHTITLTKPLDFLLGLAQIQQHGRIRTDNDVFQNAQGRHQHKVLVYHSNAASDGLGRRRHLNGFALHENLTMLRLVEAVDAFGQCRLAGTVFTQQTVNFTRPDIEGNRIDGNDLMKFLSQSVCSEQLFHFEARKLIRFRQ